MSAKASCVSKSMAIQEDPRLLFQRLSTVADILMEEGENAMRYELCSFPPALFDSGGLPLEARKPAMRDGLCALCKESAETTELSHEQFKYVLDGGSLLHILPWTRGKSLGAIILEYCTLSKFGSCHIVFDGYGEETSTKEVTHMRRNAGGGIRIIFDDNSVLQTSKDIFLSNILNKRDFVSLLGKALAQAGQNVKYAMQDADRDIVMTAVEISEQHNVVVIGEDTDLLCLLCAHFQNNNNDIYLTSTRQTRCVYCIRQIQLSLGENAERLLFSHALLGSDTTSRLFGIGKAIALRKLQDEKFKMLADFFLNSSSQRQDIIKAGENALLFIYGAGSLESLDVARKQRFTEKIAKSAAYVEPQTLPPTTAAAKFHSLRVYYQVQDWLGTTLTKQMDPTDWGFQIQKGRLVPIMTDLPPAPERLLAVITCTCKSGCSTVRCSCRKHGLKCSSACSGCHGHRCCNDVTLPETSLEDDSHDID